MQSQVSCRAGFRVWLLGIIVSIGLSGSSLSAQVINAQIPATAQRPPDSPASPERDLVPPSQTIPPTPTPQPTVFTLL